MSAISTSTQQAHRFLQLAVLYRLLASWAKIQALDLSMVRSKLMSPKNEGMPLEEANAAIEGYRRYLLLAFVADFPVVPTREMDAAWHHHILDTERYARDCKAIFGRFLHHRPSAENAPGADRERMKAHAHRTAQLYHMIFREEMPRARRAECDHRCDGPGCDGDCDAVRVECSGCCTPTDCAGPCLATYSHL